MQQRRDVCRIILIITVDGHQHITASLRNARQQSPILADIVLQIDKVKSRITAMDLFHSPEGRIGAQVIDKYYFIWPTGLCHHFADVLIKREHVPVFVMHWGNDRDVDARGRSISRGQKKTPRDCRSPNRVHHPSIRRTSAGRYFEWRSVRLREMKAGESHGSARPHGGAAVWDSKFRCRSVGDQESLSADPDRAFQ